MLDLERDSVIAPIGGNSLASLALSPDGEYLYLTDPVPLIWNDIKYVHSGKVKIFETSSNSHVGEIDVNQASRNDYPSTDKIIITPDGETAYVGSWSEIFVLDLSARTVTEVIEFDGSYVLLRSLALGPKFSH